MRNVIRGCVQRSTTVLGPFFENYSGCCKPKTPPAPLLQMVANPKKTSPPVCNDLCTQPLTEDDIIVYISSVHWQ